MRFNNFDNFSYIEASSPSELLALLRKIIKPAKVHQFGENSKGKHYAYVEILGSGKDKINDEVN
jgi:hypothetical protein